MELYIYNNFIYKKEDGVYKYLHSPIKVEQSLPFTFLCNTSMFEKTLYSPLTPEEYICKREVMISQLVGIKPIKKGTKKTTLEKLMAVESDDYIQILKDDGLL